MVQHFPNYSSTKPASSYDDHHIPYSTGLGKPVLLDHNGQPLRSPYMQRDGSATPASGLSLPHGWTFIARYSGAQNTYWHDRFDEAMRHAREDAEAMRRDAYLLSLIQERQLAVASLPWHLEVPDEKDPFQLRVKDGLTRIIKGIRNFRRIVYWLLEAIWYGRYGVQIQWEWCQFEDRESEPLKESQGGDPLQQQEKKPERKKGKLRKGITVAQAWPVNGDKIGHQYDHTPYILVHGADAMNLQKAQILNTTRGRAVALRGTWRERFIIHKHLQEDADFFAPDQAEAIHGVGVRSKLFWSNWLKMEWLANVTDFFDRVGLGVTIWKYQLGNPEALAAVKAAARDQSNRAHVFVPVSPDGGKDSGTGVERLEPPTSGAESLVRLIEYLDHNMERYVVGQEGSAAGSSSGLGNEANAEFMRDTKTRITMQDAAFLGETLSGSPGEPGLVDVIQKYTYPEAKFPVRMVFGVESGESDKKLAAVQALLQMGLEVKADEVRKAAGLSKPSDGDELVKPPQQQQPGGMPPGGGGAGGGAPPGGGGGGDPMAALMGGMGGGAPPAPAAAGGAPPEQAGGAEQQQEPLPEEEEQQEEEPQGDFLDFLRGGGGSEEQQQQQAFARDGREALRYEWQQGPEVGKSARGQPVYRWTWDGADGKRQRPRDQTVKPGTGRGGGGGGQQQQQPGATGGQQQPKQPRQKKKQAPPKKEKKASPEQVLTRTLDALDRDEIRMEHVVEIGDGLLSLTKEQLHGLREQLGIDVKGLKSATKDRLSTAIIDHLLKAREKKRDKGAGAPPPATAPANDNNGWLPDDEQIDLGALQPQQPPPPAPPAPPKRERQQQPSSSDEDYSDGRSIKSVWDNRRTNIPPRKPSPPATEQDKRQAMEMLRQAFSSGNPVVAWAELRKKMPTSMQGDAFDEMILSLADEGKIGLSTDEGLSKYSPEELNQFVRDGNNFFLFGYLRDGSGLLGGVDGESQQQPQSPPENDHDKEVQAFMDEAAHVFDGDDDDAVILEGGGDEGVVTASESQDREASAAINRRLERSMAKNTTLTSRQKADYSRTVKQVTQAMTPVARHRIGQNLAGFDFVPSSADTYEATAKNIRRGVLGAAEYRRNGSRGPNKPPNKPALEVFDACMVEARKQFIESQSDKNWAANYFDTQAKTHPEFGAKVAVMILDHDIKGALKQGWGETLGAYERSSGRLILDGGFSRAAGFADADEGRAHTYAHELAHAIDGPDNELSDSPEWQKAWQAEIVVREGQKPSLSSYAGTQASEGFAEFGRVLFGIANVDLQKVEQRFPLCAKFMQKQGLWPQQQQQQPAAVTPQQKPGNAAPPPVAAAAAAPPPPPPPSPPAPPPPRQSDRRRQRW